MNERGKGLKGKRGTRAEREGEEQQRESSSSRRRTRKRSGRRTTETGSLSRDETRGEGSVVHATTAAAES